MHVHGFIPWFEPIHSTHMDGARCHQGVPTRNETVTQVSSQTNPARKARSADAKLSPSGTLHYLRITSQIRFQVTRVIRVSAKLLNNYYVEFQQISLLVIMVEIFLMSQDELE